MTERRGSRLNARKPRKYCFCRRQLRERTTRIAVNFRSGQLWRDSVQYVMVLGAVSAVIRDYHISPITLPRLGTTCVANLHGRDPAPPGFMVLRRMQRRCTSRGTSFRCEYPRRAPKLAHCDTVCSPGTSRDSILLHWYYTRTRYLRWRIKKMNSSGVDPCLTRIFVLYEALNEWNVRAQEDRAENECFWLLSLLLLGLVLCKNIW